MSYLMDVQVGMIDEVDGFDSAMDYVFNEIDGYPGLTRLWVDHDQSNRLALIYSNEAGKPERVGLFTERELEETLILDGVTLGYVVPFGDSGRLEVDVTAFTRDEIVVAAQVLAFGTIVTRRGERQE